MFWELKWKSAYIYAQTYCKVAMTCGEVNFVVVIVIVVRVVTSIVNIVQLIYGRWDSRTGFFAIDQWYRNDNLVEIIRVYGCFDCEQWIWNSGCDFHKNYRSQWDANKLILFINIVVEGTEWFWINKIYFWNNGPHCFGSIEWIWTRD